MVLFFIQKLEDRKEVTPFLGEFSSPKGIYSIEPNPFHDPRLFLSVILPSKQNSYNGKIPLYPIDLSFEEEQNTRNFELGSAYFSVSIYIIDASIFFCKKYLPFFENEV